MATGILAVHTSRAGERGDREKHMGDSLREKMRFGVHLEAVVKLLGGRKGDGHAEGDGEQGLLCYV